MDEMPEVQLLVFGDQTETAIPMDELIQYSHKSKYISQYLENSFAAVQHVLDSLSDAEKERLKFDSFQSLSERVKLEKTPDIVLRTLVLCVAQLGSLITLDLSVITLFCSEVTDNILSTLENDSDLRNSWASQNIMIVASCAGQVPAAAAATTHSIDDLVAVAPEIVAISLRVGLDVDRRSAALSDDRAGSWARAVIGISGADAQASIKEFHKAQVAFFQLHNKSSISDFPRARLKVKYLMLAQHLLGLLLYSVHLQRLSHSSLQIHLVHQELSSCLSLLSFTPQA